MPILKMSKTLVDIRVDEWIGGWVVGLVGAHSRAPMQDVLGNPSRYAGMAMSDWRVVSQSRDRLMPPKV